MLRNGMTFWRIPAGVLAALICSAGFAQETLAPGITIPQALAPFDSASDSCTTPPGLARSLTFVQDNRRQFIEGVGFGLAAAAADRQLHYESFVANDDAQLMIDQVREAGEQRVGAIVVAPVEPRSLAPGLQAVMARGTYVGAIVPPPATTILNAPQYLVGRTIAEDAARYIEEHLNGRAKVVLLTHDSLQFLAPRFTAIRDVLGRMPGVTFVADISPTTVNEQGGYATMMTILLAQPDIDVVLGADTVVLGALRALREAGKHRPNQYLGGIDGEPEAVGEIRTEGSPYKATVSLASPIFGYALGQFAADWLEGKVVPQAVDILPYLLSRENLDEYEQDVADPARIWNDPQKRQQYLKMYGGICYDTRDQYLNFPWSSESF